MAGFLSMLPNLLTQAGRAGVFNSLRKDAEKSFGEDDDDKAIVSNIGGGIGGLLGGLKSFAGDILSDLGSENKIKSGADFGRSLARAAAHALGVGNNAANKKHDESSKRANKMNLRRASANNETTVMAKDPFMAQTNRERMPLPGETKEEIEYMKRLGPKPKNYDGNWEEDAKIMYELENKKKRPKKASGKKVKQMRQKKRSKSLYK